jgi:pimeloyl-ACP methyl ester carboxylesterase
MKRLLLALLTGAAFATSSPACAAVKTIVLVHGAFADGSRWMPVADILLDHGYSVHVVQEPQTSFAADVAATRRVLDKAGPCVLVGHSFGGSLADLADTMPPANKSIGPVGDGFLAVNPDAFPNDFAADAPKALARFMAISQVSVSGEALHAKATVAPWKESRATQWLPHRTE